MHKTHRCLLVSLLLALLAAWSVCGTGRQAHAQEGETHYLAFASDYHATEGSIARAMGGMPEDVEYVSLIGDMVGGGRDRAPHYESRTILSLVQEVFPHLDNSNVSIVWADHDKGVDDEGTNIVKGLGGYGSGPIYQGMNEDGSTAYHIYAIAFYEMKEGGQVSKEAAARFKTWVGDVDPSIPIIVLCHMPLQAKRGDNLGALYWSEALNYAATGVEGLTSTHATASITRNVIFLCAHNHTVSKDEYYFAAGGTMEVQLDTSLAAGSYSEAEFLVSGEDVATFEVEDEEYDEEDQMLEEAGDTVAQDDAGPGEGSGDGKPSSRPRPREAKGVSSNIYYTSLVAGYLKTGDSATLVTVDNAHITLQKYRGGAPADLGVDGITGAAVEGPLQIAQIKRANEGEQVPPEDTTVDEGACPLAGEPFGQDNSAGTTDADASSRAVAPQAATTPAAAPQTSSPRTGASQTASPQIAPQASSPQTDETGQVGGQPKDAKRTSQPYTRGVGVAPGGLLLVAALGIACLGVGIGHKGE